MPQYPTKITRSHKPMSYGTICRAVGSWLASWLLLAAVGMSPAQALENPSGPVLLKIAGNIEKTNNGDEAWFDLEMLQSIGSTDIQTKTPWTKGLASFTGVLIKDVMAAVGAKSSGFEALALNKYKINFTGIDYEKYPIIIAWKLNDEMLTVRTLGPLWIMFPFSDYPEIDTEGHRNAAVWQLLRMTVF